MQRMQHASARGGAQALSLNMIVKKNIINQTDLNQLSALSVLNGSAVLMKLILQLIPIDYQSILASIRTVVVSSDPQNSRAALKVYTFMDPCY